MEAYNDSAKVWKVELEPLDSFSDIVQRWHLESPTGGSPVSSSVDGVLDFRVWALAAVPEAQNRLHLVLRFPGRTVSHPANIARGDVIEIILKADPVGHSQKKCGYRISLPAAEALQGFEIGFETDGLIHSAAKVSLV